MDSPIIIRHSELLNRLVLERDTGQEVGRVERLWMYPQAHRVMGVVCRSGRFGGKRFVYKLPQLDGIEPAGLWVNGPPTQATGEQIRRLESLMEHEIWVDGGGGRSPAPTDRLGLIIDCLFNRKTGAITQYLFVDNPLRRLVSDPITLAPTEIKGFGNRRVVVDERSRLKHNRPSLKESLSNLRDQAREEYGQVTQEMRLAQQQATERAERLRRQAAEQAEALREQATEQAQTWQQQLTNRAQTWSQKLGEQAQTLGGQAQELSQELSKDWREQTQELRAGEWGAVPRVDAPDEVTWVDEAGDLPPGRSPRRSPRPRRSLRGEGEGVTDKGDPGDRVLGDRSQDWAQSPAVTRDNPWGYEGEAEDLNNHPAPLTPSGSPQPPTLGYLDPAVLAQIAAEELEDNDPWV